MTMQYVGFKVVTAWREDRVSAPPDGTSGEGYAVKYEDGYISWSPKAVFESAYVPLHPDFAVTVKTTALDCKTPASQSKESA